MLSEECEGSRYQDLSFHWVPLSQVINPAWSSHYLSAFNFQIISHVAERISQRIYSPGDKRDVTQFKVYPQVAVLNCEAQSHWSLVTEVLTLGSYFGGAPVKGNEQEIWGYFNVCDFNLPSEEELKQMNSIIIPASEASALDSAKVGWMSTLIAFIQNVHAEF